MYKLVLKLQVSSVNIFWGKMILTSDGLSYMDFKVHIDVNKFMDGVLNERWGVLYPIIILSLI